MTIISFLSFCICLTLCSIIPIQVSCTNIKDSFQFIELSPTHRVNESTSNHDDAVVSPYIHKGKEAPIGKYRYTAGILHRKDFTSQCGGTLISDKYVLTAAHCHPKGSEINYVVIGSHYNNAKRTTDGEVIKVKKVTIHPEYNTKNMHHDFAIVELERKSKFDIKKVILANVDESHEQPGDYCNAHGWGRTIPYNPRSASQVLLEVDLQLLNRKKCEKQFVDIYLRGIGENPDLIPDSLKPRWIIPRNQICVDSITGEGTLQGDSGGPLVVDNQNERPTLIGVTSYGNKYGGGKAKSPTMFASVSSAYDFINTHSKGHEWAVPRTNPTPSPAAPSPATPSPATPAPPTTPYPTKPTVTAPPSSMGHQLCLSMSMYMVIFSFLFVL